MAGHFIYTQSVAVLRTACGSLRRMRIVCKQFANIEADFSQLSFKLVGHSLTQNSQN